mmetsp:Transcript_22710/g.63113  ORF Transcript_22710/g.63113 Transcript_22710/m.63113 type:complete len:206 (-) Transcript_22710:1757-2374(-)
MACQTGNSSASWSTCISDTTGASPSAWMCSGMIGNSRRRRATRAPHLACTDQVPWWRVAPRRSSKVPGFASVLRIPRRLRRAMGVVTQARGGTSPVWKGWCAATAAAEWRLCLLPSCKSFCGRKRAIGAVRGSWSSAGQSCPRILTRRRCMQTSAPGRGGARAGRGWGATTSLRGSRIAQRTAPCKSFLEPSPRMPWSQTIATSS